MTRDSIEKKNIYDHHHQIKLQLTRKNGPLLRLSFYRQRIFVASCQDWSRRVRLPGPGRTTLPPAFNPQLFRSATRFLSSGTTFFSFPTPHLSVHEPGYQRSAFRKDMINLKIHTHTI